MAKPSNLAKEDKHIGGYLTSTLWHQVILSIYGTHSNGWDVNTTVRWSHRCPWKTIAQVFQDFPSILGQKSWEVGVREDFFEKYCSLRKMALEVPRERNGLWHKDFSHFVRLVVGNGERIRFWEDLWWSNQLFKSLVFVIIRLVFSEIFFLGLVKSLKSYLFLLAKFLWSSKAPSKVKALAWPSLIRPNLSGPYLNPIISLSLSLIPVISPCSQSQGRKRFPDSRIVVRKHSPPTTFPANFPATVFSTPQGAPEEIFNLSQSTGTRKPIHAPPTRVFPAGDCISRAGAVRAREPRSGDALPPQARLTPTSHPSYLFVQSEPCTVTSPESGGRSEIPNLGGNDSSPILITGHKLNGHNYLQWSQSVLLFICGKGKDEYLTREAVMPETTEPGFRKWKIENSMIMSWLINSMNNDIGENFLLFGTAKDIWDAAKELTQVLKILQNCFRLNQFYMTAAKESSQLLSITTHSKANCGTKETVQVLPRTKQGIWMMLEAESWALNPCQVSGRLFQSSGGDRQKRDRPWCDYCKKPGHYKETCWKLHGKPADWKPKHGLTEMAKHTWLPTLRAHHVPEPSPFNKEQMEMPTEIIKPSWQWQYYRRSAILQNYKPSNGHSSVILLMVQSQKLPGQDLKSGKMISSAELCSGLYLLSCGQFSNQVSQASCVQSQSMSESFNSVSNSKGESMNEHQVWESFLRVYLLFTQSQPNPSQFAPTELSTPMPPSVQPAQHTNEEEKTGIRARITVNMCQYIDSNSSLPEENIGEDRAGEVLIPSIDDSTLPIALRKGVRRCTDHPIGNYVTYEGLSPSYRAFATSLDDTQVPNTIQEALKISEWKKAVQDEIDALEKNGTWTITDLPVGKRPVGCKWIFTIKYKADGSVERFKARLVARGFTQSYGIDYQETFAPVAKLNTIRILLSLAVNQDWCLQQLDIKNAFLNGDLEEEVYMEIPPGFEESMAKNQNLKKYLSEEFEVKDLGNLKYFLGMEVARSRKGIVVSQRKYILDLLKETGMLGCKPIDTPMDSQKKLGIEKESTPVDRGRYQRLVGRLIYLSHTRPDIGFAVSAVSQFMHSPTEEHMEAVYRILRYLKMTPGKGLFFRKTENRDTEVYSDADWAGNIIDRRSTSGYCSFVWGNLVTWRSKKQSVVARSSAEAEYRALAQGICEGIWIKRVLSELGQTSSSPILMMCDNQAAISIAKNPVHHDRTKHVEIDRHFITEKVTSETVKLTMFLPSTKPQTSSPKLYLGLTSKT
ncbi:Retrovirus-related Pol polyprotein from transposon RE1 [Vitis vinifera]|uniref:Retrovirus-related Pol polyprotein from transposon RE1 n=1 Tax=Vitis vinifera TaxID=29760 RepID=A0A438I9T0_VITVI|nr:Retrovirus-related Pol polyprotein from transposon RE1 [Vitis vinifera]